MADLLISSRRLLATIAAALLLSLTLAPGFALADDEPAADAAPPTLPPVAMEAQGSCETPRQAWLQLLYWLQRERWDPAQAAICFDTARLDDEQAAVRAIELKEILDANGWFIQEARIPTDPNYVDPERGSPIYEDPAVTGRGIILVRQPDGRWLFSADSLDRVPDLYPSLSRHIVTAVPSWLRSEVLGVEAWKFLGVVALIFFALFIQKLVTFVLNGYLRRLLAKNPALAKAVGRVERPLGGLAMAATFHFGFPLLLFPIHISQIALVATKALAAYSFVWLGFRIIDVIAEWLAAKAAKTDSKLDEQLVPLLRKTLKIFTAVIGGLFVLQNLDIDVSSLLAGLGLGGLAFALAARDTIANFFGSVMIFVDKPFQLGDWIVVGDVEGIVEEVGFRTTKVRTFYDSLVTVPNANVVNTAVDNYGMRSYRRYFTTLSINYGTPPEKVQAFCEAVRAIIKSIPETRKDFYMVEFSEFGDSGLRIMVYVFVKVDSWNTEMRVRTRMNLDIMRAAQQLGVGFAFPTRTLHVDSLAQPGESKPAHHGTTEIAALAAVVGGFAPGGKLGNPEGVVITPHEYDCRTDVEGGSVDAEG
jgi:MscS family membrane protein